VSSPTAALEHLERVVGPAHLITATGGAATLAEGVSEYRVDGQMPLAVAHPGTQEEVAALLRVAREHGLSVLPRGAGRHMHFGSVPGPIGLLLSLARLNQVVEYDANDLTITVQAGMTLGELARITGANRQVLPLDPPGGEAATIGGVAAANLAGPLRMRYGAPRDLALGLRVALSSGEVIRTGARTVKNVAGYDLTKLFVGSYGSLGAILEVTLRLIPAPEERALFVASLAPARAREVAAALVGGRLDIATCDLLNHESAKGMRLFLPVTLRPENVVLCVGVMGASEAVARQERELKALLPEGVARAEVQDLGKRVRDVAYPRSREGEEAKRRDELSVLRLSVPLTAVVDLLATISAEPGWKAAAWAGDGTVYAVGPAEVRVLMRLRGAAEKAGGYAVLEYGAPELKRSFPVWGESVANLDLMRALRRSLDPSETMGCGRLV